MNSESGLSAMLIYKQGIFNQGGPADIFMRRVVLPEDFDPAVDNPYAYENMVCEDEDGNSLWTYKTDADDDGIIDEPNPNYLQGLCLAPAINISGTTIVTCDNWTSGADACAEAFPWETGEGAFPKVTSGDNFLMMQVTAYVDPTVTDSIWMINPGITRTMFRKVTVASWMAILS